MVRNDWILFACLAGILAFLFSDSLFHVILFHEQHQLFLFSGEYFRSHLADAGARLDYPASFIIQFFYYPWLGIVLFSLMLSGLYLFSRAVCVRVTGQSDPLQLALLLPLYLLVRYTSVDYPFARLTGLFLSLLLYWMASRTGKKMRYPLGAVVCLALCGLIGWKLPAIALASVVLPCLSALLLHRLLTSKKVTVVLTVVAVLLAFCTTSYHFVYSYNNRERVILETGQRVKDGDWDAVLRCASRYRGENQLIDYFRNMALFHTGRMPYDLLRYAQSFGAASLYLPWTGENRSAEYGHYLYEQLGYLNEAHHWAFESMVVNGETAPNLLNLIRYNIATGRPKVACRWINVLKQSLFYRRQAWTYERIVFSGAVPGLHALPHAEGGKARFTNVLNLGPELLFVCEREPDNRMAFEYLMSQLLLSNQVERFAANLHRYRRFDYPALPRLYEEALLVYKLGVDEATFARLGLPVGKETGQRFQAYYEAARQGDTARLRRDFGDTYWYYLNYRSIYGQKVRND